MKTIIYGLYNKKTEKVEYRNYWKYKVEEELEKKENKEDYRICSKWMSF